MPKRFKKPSQGIPLTMLKHTLEGQLLQASPSWRAAAACRLLHALLRCWRSTRGSSSALSRSRCTTRPAHTAATSGPQATAAAAANEDNRQEGVSATERKNRRHKLHVISHARLQQSMQWLQPSNADCSVAHARPQLSRQQRSMCSAMQAVSSTCTANQHTVALLLKTWTSLNIHFLSDLKKLQHAPHLIFCFKGFPAAMAAAEACTEQCTL